MFPPPDPYQLQIADVGFSFEDYLYRTPIKFGGTVVDRVTLLNVEMTGRVGDHPSVRGFGSMPLGNVWAWPSRTLTYDQTLAAMKKLVASIAGNGAAFEGPDDVLEIGLRLEHDNHRIARNLSDELDLAEPIPPLATLVCGSAFDAALHDVFGKGLGLNCYRAYEFLSPSIGDRLKQLLPVGVASARASDVSERRWILDKPTPRLPLYHLIGALDPLTEGDVTRPVGDGLPETLGEWILHDHLTHLKIKLNGDDLRWDVDRVVAVDRVASEVQTRRGAGRWHYSLDFNEKCQDVEYLLDFLGQVRERTPAGLERIQYIEQPTARDLKANPDNRMHAAAKIRPIVIDESLLDIESLLMARDMGYTGVALKACKGQTQSLLLAAAAQLHGMFLCVQDLTCPGASLIHSAGLAAHIPGVAAIEANARQYVPAANRAWEVRFPGLFSSKDGTLATETLTGLGLGAVPL